MSYQYGQFSTGFDLARPEPQALVFEETVGLRGTEVTIVTLTPSGYDSYGHTEYTETTRTEQAFISRDPKQLGARPGSIKQASAEALFVQWAPIDEELTRIEIDGERYRVVGLDKTSAYTRVLLTREVEA